MNNDTSFINTDAGISLIVLFACIIMFVVPFAVAKYVSRN